MKTTPTRSRKKNNAATMLLARRRLAVESLERRALLSAMSLLDVESQFAQPSLSALAAVTNPTPRGYTPSQIAQAYGFSGITFSGGIKGDGTGQTIAIVDAYNDPNIANDLRTFDATFGLADPPNFSVVNQNGGKSLPATDSGWSEEISLDVEWAHAMAPGANILLVEANSSSLTDLLSAVNYARGAAGVSVVSMSWGSGEFASETQYDQYFTTPAGHSGVTFVASAGDSGAQATWPAISPNVLSVGGTTLSVSSNTYAGESAWSGSGGGLSRFESEPAFQKSAQSTGRLSSPDVSFDANPNTGFAVYDTVATGGRTGWFQIGGTSAGAPQWAALVAIANQGRVLSGQGALSGAQSQIFSLPSSDFHDVTTGSNGYAAQIGYDLVTGRGSPVAGSVIHDLVNNTSAAASSGQSSTSTSTPTQSASTTTYYEWVYWNHRWWLVIVTAPNAAVDSSEFDAIDSGLQQATAAASNGTSASEANSASPAAEATASAVVTVTTQSPVMIVAAVPNGSSADGQTRGDARLPDGPAAENDDSSSEQGDSSGEASRQPAGSGSEGSAAKASDSVSDLSLDWREPPLPMASDVCFADAGWVASLAESAVAISESMDFAPRWDVTGMALAVAIGMGALRVDREEADSPELRPRRAPRRLMRA